MSADIVRFLVMKGGHPNVIIVEHHIYEAYIADLIAASHSEHWIGGPITKIPLVGVVKCCDTHVLSRAGNFRPADFN